MINTYCCVLTISHPIDHLASMLSLSSTKLEGLPNDYSPSVVGAVYSSTHGSTFSTSERMAASRAVLRHRQHLKNHSNTRKPSGLHPWYVSLNGFGKVSSKEQQEVYQLHKETLHDLFDSVCSLFFLTTPHDIFCPDHNFGQHRWGPYCSTSLSRIQCTGRSGC
jgi:hypothetical protein